MLNKMTLSDCVSHHPGAAAAALVVLAVLVVGLYVYYHGVLSFGPYACCTPRRTRRRPAEKESESESESDGEAGRLIEAINAKQ